MPMTKRVQVVETVVYFVDVEGDTDEELRAKAIEAVVQASDTVSFVGVTAREATIS